jgi:hypothetical protein
VCCWDCPPPPPPPNFTVFTQPRLTSHPLQEAPGSVPAGRLPRSKNVILLHDLIDIARPGEEIDVTGIFQHGYDYSLNAQSGFPVFATFIEANNVKRRADDFSLANITEDTLAEIQKLARDKNAGERIINSMAPSIYGHKNIKASIAMALFGGQEKQVGSHRLRCVRTWLLLCNVACVHLCVQVHTGPPLVHLGNGSSQKYGTWHGLDLNYARSISLHRL